MKVYYCGREDCESGHFFGPAVRSHQLIHFVLKGKGVYRTEYGEYEVKEGEAFLIRPEEVTYYRADQEYPWSYAWIAFDGSEADTVLKRYYPDRKLPVCAVAEPDAISQWFDGLLTAFGSADENQEKVLGYYYLIMSCLHQADRKNDTAAEEGYYQKAAAFIRHNYSYPMQIQEIASYVGIDRTYLYRIFMHQAGISPKHFLSRQRLNQAKEMLAHTDYRITEIAYSCGYHDSSAFCRHFQKEMGISPSKYRNMAKDTL